MVRFVPIRFKAKENLQRCGNVFLDILITSKRVSVFGMFNTFKNFNRKLNKTSVSCSDNNN